MNATARSRRGATFVVGLLVAGAMTLAAPVAPVAADQTGSFFNITPITIPVGAPVSPYPSTVTVSDFAGAITRAELWMTIEHAYSGDLDIMLVGPGGQNLIVMSDAGANAPLSGMLIIDDFASAQMPIGNTLTLPGRFKPTNYGSGDVFPAPAPTPSAETTMATFNGTNANGEWSLYVFDDFAALDGGVITSWGLILATDGPTLYQPSPPARLFDTRPSQPQGARPVTKAKIPEGTAIKVKPSGSASIPGINVGAVSMNVTVNQPEGDGYVSVYPCTSTTDPPPLVSSVNFRAGQTVANPVIAAVSETDEVCFFAARTTHLIVDVNSWFGRTTLLPPTEPTRLFDTRPTQPAGALVVPKVKLSSGQTLEVEIGGHVGIPPGAAEAMVLNVTVNQPAEDGYVTVYPKVGASECGAPPPTSNVNFLAGQTVANNVIVGVGHFDTVCFYASRSLHLIVDLNSWFRRPNSVFNVDSGFVGVDPVRMVDTRLSRPQGTFVVPKVKVGPEAPLTVSVLDTLGVTAEATFGVVVTVTVTQPDADGFITVYPCGTVPPTSSVNFRAGQTVANTVVTPVTAAGNFCVYAAKPTHVIIDMMGSFPAFLPT